MKAKPGVSLFALSLMLVMWLTPLTQAGEWDVVFRGPHERHWQKAALIPRPGNGMRWATNQYVELATGLHYWQDGQWQEAREEIEIFEGHAVARQGQHQVIFAGNLNWSAKVGTTILQFFSPAMFS